MPEVTEKGESTIVQFDDEQVKYKKEEGLKLNLKQEIEKQIS